MTDIHTLADHIGETVEIWPRVNKGWSRDTEPGLQPWKAELIGVKKLGDREKAIVLKGGADRDVDAELVKLLPQEVRND